MWVSPDQESLQQLLNHEMIFQKQPNGWDKKIAEVHL